MTKDKFNQLLQSARDIVRHADDGQPLDPLTVTWAREVLTMNPRKSNPTPVRDKILALWNDDVMAGFSPQYIAEETEHPIKKSRELCALMAQDGILFKLGGGRGNRFRGNQVLYFANAQACELARPAFETAMLAEKKPVKTPRKPKAEKPLKILRLGKPRVNLERRPSVPFNPTDGAVSKARTRAVTAPAGPAIVPPHVRVQIIATPPDPRYHVDLAALPEGGFSSEWQRLRAGGAS